MESALDYRESVEFSMDNQLQLTVNVIATDRSIYMIENGRLNARIPRKTITCLEMKFDASDRPTENTSRIEHAKRRRESSLQGLVTLLLTSQRPKRNTRDSVMQLEVADVRDRTMVRSLAGRGTASESRCL